MKHHLAKLSKNSWVQGGFFLTSSNLLVGFLNYLFNIFVGRALGPEGLGEITALFSYTIVLSIPMGALVSLLIQKIGAADDPSAYAVSIHAWISQKIKKWWCLALVMLGATPFVPKITNLSPLSGYALPVFLILSFVGAYYTGALQGLHVFFWYAAISVVTVLIKLAGAGVALIGTGGLVVVLGFVLISSVFGLVANHIIFVKKIRNHSIQKKLHTRSIWHVMKDSQLWYATGVTAAMALVNNIDIIFVKKFFDAETAGFYSVWSLFAKIIFYLLSPLVTMAYIFFSSKKHEVRHQIALIASLVLLIVAGVSANLSYGAMGMWLVRALFGVKFTSVVPYLEWAAYFGIGYTMMAFLMYYFLAKKSRLSLVPMILVPFLVGALFAWGRGIEQVMYICTIFTYGNITIFLGAFFWTRMKFLLS